MDRITYFQYAFGRIEDLKEGTLENLRTIDSLSDIETTKLSENPDFKVPQKGIILPKFIGVYQDWRLKADNGREREYEEEFEQIMKGMEDGLNGLIKTIGELRGHKDGFNERLIHICFDPTLYPQELVRSLLGEGSGRIRVSPYYNHPNFNEKNTSLDEIYTGRLNDFFNQPDKDKKREEIEKIAAGGYEEMRIQLQRFGLTRQESTIFEILGRLRPN